MASRSEQNLSCPVCCEIFQEPVLLSCGHSFCKACLQRWWTQNTSLECPLCKRRALQRDPPLNLVLKNLCEDFLQDRAKRLSAETEALCSLHNENLKLFCLDDQQPLCVICLHSNSHKNHSIRPINEAAQECRDVLWALLKPKQEKLELLNDAKGNFDQTAQDIEVQAQDTERQIKDTILMLQKLLKEEKQVRIDAVKREKNQKIQMMKSRSNTLSRDTDALSDTVRATEEVLQAADLSFLHNYTTAAEIAQHSLVEVPQPITGGLIDVTRHLNNLSINILDSMKKKVTSSPNPQTAAPKSTADSVRADLPGLRLTQRQSCSETSQSEALFMPPLWRSRSVERNLYAPRYAMFMEPHEGRDGTEERKQIRKSTMSITLNPLVHKK